MSTMTVSVSEVKAHLSALLETAAAGTPVTIARHGKPLVTMLPASDHAPRVFGIYPGRVPDDEALLAPMTEEELAAWE